MFSPHRFLAHPGLVAALGPIHARYLQFLKQYLALSYPHLQFSLFSGSTSSPSDAENRRLFYGPLHNLLPVLHVDLDAGAIAGHPVSALSPGALSPALRERFAALVQYEHISDRAPASGAGALALFPECDGGLVDATGRAGWRWLFAFCIAALNDPRVAEVSQRDYETRLAISNKFTPLIREMLLPNQSPL